MVRPSDANAASDAPASAERQYLIKAAFIYDLAKYVQWPADAGDDLALCTLGNDPFGAAWKAIAGKRVGERELRIVKARSATNLVGCDILFIGESEQLELPRLLAHTRTLPILTVSEMANFPQHGGIVTLKAVDNRLRFEVNLAAARHAGLVLSPDVLELAEVVQVEAEQTGQL